MNNEIKKEVEFICFSNILRKTNQQNGQPKEEFKIILHERKKKEE